MAANLGCKCWQASPLTPLLFFSYQLLSRFNFSARLSNVIAPVTAQVLEYYESQRGQQIHSANCFFLLCWLYSATHAKCWNTLPFQSHQANKSLLTASTDRGIWPWITGNGPWAMARGEGLGQTLGHPPEPHVVSDNGLWRAKHNDRRNSSCAGASNDPLSADGFYTEPNVSKKQQGENKCRRFLCILLACGIPF